MNPLKWVRKIGKFVRGGATPVQILLACIFGMMLGLVPGFNMVHVTLIFLILTLNVSIGLAIATFAIGKGLMYPLAPLTAKLGRFVIEDMGISGLFIAAGDTPVVALMNLYVHCVIGGILFAVVLGLVVGFLVARIVVMLRKGLVSAGQKSPRVARLAAALPVKIILLLLFGRQKKPLAELLAQKNPLLRKWGIVVAVVFVALIVGGATLAVDYYLAGELETQLGKANGAEVNIEHADLSLLQGRARIVNIRFTNPQDPTQNRFQADEISVDVSIRGLLTKRAIVDEIVIPAAVAGKQREQPGDVYPAPEPDEPESPDDLWTWLKDPEKIKETFDRLKTYKEWLEKIRERIEARDKGEVPPPDPNAPYLERSSRHLLTQHPTILIRRIRIESIRFEGDQNTYRLEGRQISSHPELVPEPMAIRFGDVTGSGEQTKLGQNRRVFVAFNFQPGQMHEMDLLWNNLPIGGAIQLSEKSPVQIQKGLAVIQTKGGFSAGKLDLAGIIKLSEFDGSVRKDRKVLGMDNATAQQVLQRASELPVVLRLGGTLTRPTAVIDTQATTAAMQEMLPQIFQNVIGDQLRQHIGGQGASILDGLLGGRGKEPEKDGQDEDQQDDKDGDSKEDEPRNPLGDLLRGL